MDSDEKAIREFFPKWQQASSAGDNEALRGMMAEDIVFLTVGNPPMQGRDAFFALAGSAPNPFHLDFQQEVKEIKVMCDWAYSWTHLVVTAIPNEGAQPIRRLGDIFTLFRKEADGRWVIARDANLLTIEKSSG